MSSMYGALELLAQRAQCGGLRLLFLALGLLLCRLLLPLLLSLFLLFLLPFSLGLLALGFGAGVHLGLRLSLIHISFKRV